MLVRTLRVAVVVVALLLQLAIAGSSDEFIILANCINVQNPTEQSSEMAYYSHPQDKSPAAIAKVQTPFGRTTWWEGGTPVSATFPDGNVFSADIPKVITEQGSFVGVGKNNAGTFSCWRDWRMDYYSHDNIRCSGIYTCDHRSPPGNELQVFFTFYSSSIVLDGDIDPADVFHTIWDARDAQSCQNKAISIPGTSCTISYHCVGADQWGVTNHMAETLQGPLAKAAKTKSSYTVRECVDWAEQIPPKCAQYEIHTRYFTWIVSSGRIDVTNVSPAGSGIPASLAGWLTYDITCPSSHANCAGCKAAELTLMAGAAVGTYTMNPEVSGIFVGANVFTSAICTGIGC
jgi:hypothetical protein